MMIKTAFVDVCQPVDRIKKECARLEEQWYIPTGQVGGGEEGSCIIYECYKGTTKKEKIGIQDRNVKHKRFCEDFFGSNLNVISE